MAVYCEQTQSISSKPPIHKGQTIKNSTTGLINDTNRRGIVLMIASMALFALADTLVKLSTKVHSPAQVMFFLLSGALVLFTSMALVKGEKLTDIRAFSPILLARYATEIIAMVGMITALALVPISIVGAITQATPLLVALGGFFLFKEHIGWRRWVCIIFGFIGVLLIVKPTTAGFDVSVLWAVLALIALSLRDLTTKLVPPDMPSTSLASYTMAAMVPFALCWVLMRGEALLPGNMNWLVIVPMVMFGAMGYLFLIASLRSSDVSVVMPFRFSRVVFLLGVGVLIFGERPDKSMLIGVLIIVVSGAYTMHREGLIKARKLSDESLD